MASTTTSAGGNVSMVISCSAGNISRSGSTVTADITASVKMATSSYTYNSIAVWINGTKYTVFDSKSGKNHTSSGTTYSKTANVTWTGVADSTTSLSYTCGYGWNAWSPSNKTSLSDSFSFSANTGSFNLNILNPDGSEPYSTGEAGSVEFSSNGGSSYSRLYNEPASSYVIGTAFRLRNFTPGTGRKYSSISGVSGGSGTSADPWYVSQGSSTTISISTAWQTYTIAYSANGGTGAPGNQTKTYNQNLTLSSTKPTKSNTTATGYTVTFNGNGGTASKASQAATDTTTYTFNNWKDGAGTTYAAGGTYTKNQADTLTAQWTSSTTKGAVTTATATKSSTTSTRTVTYNANGGYCGTASANSTATVSYSCSGWYTATSGGTKRASSGGSYTPAASETVYAQWGSSTGTFSAITSPTPSKANTTATRKVTFNANGGTCSTTSLNSTQTTTYTQNGWWTAASGGTQVVKANTSYTPSATQTVYAQYTSSAGNWSAITLPAATKANGSTSCTVTFNGNGGSTPSAMTSSATITYTQTGWWTATSGGTNRGKSGATYTPSAAETVYAQFSSSTGAYAAITLPTPTRSGYKFMGWSTSSTATSGTTGSYTPTGNVTLYATWQPDQATAWAKSNGSWVKGKVWVKVNGTWQKAKSIQGKTSGTWKKNK